jgi:hypothetical protein
MWRNLSLILLSVEEDRWAIETKSSPPPIAPCQMFVSVCLTKEIPSERQSLKLQMPRDSVIIQNGPLITILFSLSDCPFWTAPRVSLSLSLAKSVWTSSHHQHLHVWLSTYESTFIDKFLIDSSEDIWQVFDRETHTHQLQSISKSWSSVWV